ncbi:MAG: hypothetical protein ACKOC5_00220 [Chloroflexota bacterium]
MRITRETLMKIAADAAARRARSAPDLLAAYLCGSLLDDEYLLGGTTDIDLVFVYAAQAPGRREVVRLTDEVHLDILHHDQRAYRDTRKLRVHPWMGPVLNGCKVLYDPQHFMDFTQASVRGQYDRPDHVFARARPLAEDARQLWMGLNLGETDAGPAEVDAYLRALEQAVNAICSLKGGPLSERRFLPHFQKRAEQLGRPGLYAGLLGLLGWPNIAAESPAVLEAWLPDWGAAYQAACGAGGVGAAGDAGDAGAAGETGVPAAAAGDPLLRLHPDRLHYYSAAFQFWLESGKAEAVLWPLARTWTAAALRLPAGSPELAGWRAAFSRLGLAGLPFTGRIDALDAYLDGIDEQLERWARANGAWEE